MDEIILHRTELLVLLDALEATQLIGFDSADLIPTDIEAHRALVQEGHARLERRGALRLGEDGVLVLAPDLAQLAGVLTSPSNASIIVRDIPGLGRQLFVHCTKGPNIVEHTLPEPEVHRFALLADRAALIARWVELLPVADTPSTAAFNLTVEAFMTMKEVAENNNISRATTLITAAPASADDAGLVIDAIRNPDFSASVALLKCLDRQIVDGYNPLVVSSINAARSLLYFVSNVKYSGISTEGFL